MENVLYPEPKHTQVEDTGESRIRGTRTYAEAGGGVGSFNANHVISGSENESLKASITELVKAPIHLKNLRRGETRPQKSLWMELAKISLRISFLPLQFAARYLRNRLLASKKAVPVTRFSS